MRKLIFGSVLALLFAAVPAFAQGGGGGGGGGGRAGGGRGGMMGGADPAYTQLVNAVAECNLDPSFTLTSEQKTAIKKVRDDLTGAQTKWRTDHAADLTKLTEERTAARSGGGDMTAVNDKQTALMATQPKSDDAQAAIKKALTPDQLKAVEAKVTELQAARGAMGGGRGGRGGAGGGGGGGGGGI